MEEPENITMLLDKFKDGISLNEQDLLKKQLKIIIEHLLEHDFSRLLHLLYRVDISEKKLKDLIIEQKGEDPSEIITNLIISRHVEKLKYKKSFNSSSRNIPDSEKW